MVYYLKYRPQTITELDSTSLREKLTAVLLNSESIAHAFLFTGPKGLGKTSTARIVAKVINCEKHAKNTGKEKKGENKKREKLSDIEPCNECDSCLSITNGTNMDVLEIDAASNRGIDEIRDLKEKVKLSPLSAIKKVYIIDEVHMLTTEAFNALLKTLEEPPGHVVFILCTTEPQKIPATILSRCTHIMFLPATSEELVRSFKRIAKGEGLSISDSVLSSIASLSEAGFRDGAKILEELSLLSSGKEITEELIEQQYKTGSISYQISEVVTALTLQDTKACLEIIGRVNSQGIDMKYFHTRLLLRLHEELLIILGVLKSDGKHVALFSIGELHFLLELLSKTHDEMKFSVLAQIPLELAVVEWSQVIREKSDKTGGVVPAAVLSSPDAVEEVMVTTETVTLKSLRKNLGTISKIKALYGEEQVKKTDEEESLVKTVGVSLLHFDSKTDTKEWTDNLWKSIISEMKNHNHTVAGVLRGCVLKSYDKKSIVIEAPYEFHKEKLSETKNIEALESICRQLTGNPVSVSVVLKAK